MTFQRQIIEYQAGVILTTELPRIAEGGLGEGLDSPSLCILAGMDRRDNLFEMEMYLKRALTELNIEQLSTREAALKYAHLIIEDIIANNKDIVAGAREIFFEAFDKHDFRDGAERFLYDSVGLAKAYGLLDDCLELPNADIRWQKDKTNERLLEEIKVMLRAELIRWHNEFKEGQS